MGFDYLVNWAPRQDLWCQFVPGERYYFDRGRMLANQSWSTESGVRGGEEEFWKSMEPRNLRVMIMKPNLRDDVRI